MSAMKGDSRNCMGVKDLNAYQVLKEEDLKGIKAKGCLLRHKKSGARILLVENDDDNKVFSIGFRTRAAYYGALRPVWFQEFSG